mmetsp:Transcript_38094/g.36451  ORF Transcript_38094/g.36451 Transcript_38094/m.36451 type:complete len:274 (+) Transcript_38094:55-876(+)
MVGLFVVQVFAYLAAHFGSQTHIGLEITIRVLFTIFHFLIIFIIENNLDFRKFRTILNMGLNMLMVTFSVEANPVHTIVIISIMTYPLLNIADDSSRQFKERVEEESAKKMLNQDDELPEMGLLTKPKHLFGIQTRLIQSGMATGFLGVLLYTCEELTPDFFHFATSFEPEYGHYLWVFLLWSTYKCFFIHESSNTTFTNKADSLISLGEFLAGLLVTGNLSWATFLIFLSLFSLLKARNSFPRPMNLAIVMFLLQYFLQNVIVNTVDWVFIR